MKYKELCKVCKMPKADEALYKLLNAALAHYRSAVEVNSLLADRMKSTARAAIGTVRQAARREGDEELLNLCDAAEKTLRG